MKNTFNDIISEKRYAYTGKKINQTFEGMYNKDIRQIILNCMNEVRKQTLEEVEVFIHGLKEPENNTEAINAYDNIESLVNDLKKITH